MHQILLIKTSTFDCKLYHKNILFSCFCSFMLEGYLKMNAISIFNILKQGQFYFRVELAPDNAINQI